MTNEEYIDYVVGLPWVNRACSFSELDCWGNVILYYRHVMSVELPEVAGFSDGSRSIAEGFFEQVDTGKWALDDSGIVFMSFMIINGARTPVHCGVRIGDNVVHAQGSEEKGGQVMLHKWHTIKRMYKGDVELYRYVG